jgi:hypothetical protein
MYIIRLKDCKSVNMFFLNHQKLLYHKCFVCSLLKKNNLGAQIFFIKNIPFYLYQTGFSKTYNAFKKKKRNIFYTESLTRKVDLASPFFHYSEKIN